jgi:hypothetical protein
MKRFALILCALMLFSGKAFCQEEINAERFEGLRILKYDGSYFANGLFLPFRTHYAVVVEPIFSKIYFSKNDSTLFLKGTVVDSSRYSQPCLVADILVGRFYIDYQNNKDTTNNGFNFIEIRQRIKTDSVGQFDVAIKLLPEESICFVTPESYGSNTIAHFAMYEVFKLLEE